MKMLWEKAKSGRSHCNKCHDRIEQFQKRLRVPTKFGIRDGFLFYCETCASVIYNVSESVQRITEGGQGRFYKYFRKITLG
jgi:hypothetical protein